MPRFVDADHRKQEIALATMRLIAGRGLRALTLRAVAAELGGSVTLVTHYYSSRIALLRDLARQMIVLWEVELEEMERGSHGDWDRLRITVHWMLPLDEDAWIQERARINLLAAADDMPELRASFDAFDARMRRFLAEHLARVIAADRVDALVDLIRICANGLVLCAMEHPSDWPAERQIAVLDDALAAFGLDRATAAGPESVAS